MATMAEPFDSPMLDAPSSDYDIAIHASPHPWPHIDHVDERSMEETMDDGDASGLDATVDAQDVEIDMDGYQDTAEYEMSDAEHLIEDSVDQELVDVDVDVDIANDQPLDTNAYASDLPQHDPSLLSGVTENGLQYPSVPAPTDSTSHIGEDHFMAHQEPHEHLTAQGEPSEGYAEPEPEYSSEYHEITEIAPTSALSAAEAPSDPEIHPAVHDAGTEYALQVQEQHGDSQEYSNEYHFDEPSLSIPEPEMPPGSYTTQQHSEIHLNPEDPIGAGNPEENAAEEQGLTSEEPQPAVEPTTEPVELNVVDEFSELPPLPEGSDDGYDEEEATALAGSRAPSTDPQDGEKDPHEVADGVYIDPPPPILLYLSSTESTNVCIFNTPSRSGTPAAGSSTSPNEDYVVLLQQHPTLYYDPLPALFDALRQEQAIMESVDLATCELVLDAFDLQLVISEVNLKTLDTNHELTLIYRTTTTFVIFPYTISTCFTITLRCQDP